MADNSLGAKVGVPVVLPTITPWETFTPTIVGCGTVTANTAKRKQVGDSWYIRGSFVFGTPTAVPLTISMPNNEVVVSPDGSSAYRQLGDAYVLLAAVGNEYTVFAAAGDTALRIGKSQSGTQAPTVPLNGSDVAASGQVFSYEVWAVPTTALALTSTTAYGAGLATSVKSGLVGGGNGSAAATGYINERLTTSRLRSATVAMTTGVAANITASPLVLSPGTYTISGVFGISATSVTVASVSVSKTSATLSAADTIALPTAGEVRVQISGSLNETSLVIPAYDVEFTTSTTLYLVGSISGTSPAGYGYLQAVRRG